MANGLSPAQVIDAVRAMPLPWPISQVTVVAEYAASSSTVLRLRLSTGAEAGPPATAVAKAYGPDAYDQAEGELFFHRRASAGAPAAELLGAVDDPVRRRAVLLFEDLTDRHPAGDAPVTAATVGRAVAAIAGVHARWWESQLLDDPVFARARSSAVRLAAAWPPAVVGRHGGEIVGAGQGFRSRHGDLGADEADLLRRVAAGWGPSLAARTAGRTAITLVHGDLHPLGNLLTGPSGEITILDWAECAPGLPAGDISYLLTTVAAADRVERDRAVLADYRAALAGHGIDYPAEQCEWDFRFAILTGLLQSVLQDSPRWLRATLPTAQAWRCAELLPPA